ncbi:MAG TPA: DNA repair protein RecN [Caldimonas sp.]|jgi:DNA repair protein RecN (Recombination protein N)|nr:DNA repair protein RecN [Caldimonas sp.]HEX4235879.1 DNA repair protein RecN [Caldimonas sp.]
MLHRLAIRDFVIVDALEIEFAPGFGVLSGETGAGKSILVDALQLALGSRGDAGVVREGRPRAEISAEFDVPPRLAAWLADAGFDADAGDAGRMLMRRAIDAQGKSRAWINGGTATIAQLRDAAEHLVDIHGQHAWQGLTRAPAVRALLDDFATLDTRPLAALWSAWRNAAQALTAAREQQGDLEREHERLAWQVGEVAKLAPGSDEWPELDAEHTRLAHGQSLIAAARTAIDAISEADASADALVGRAVDALQSVAEFDPRLQDPLAALQGAQAELQDAAHSLAGYLDRVELDPERLREVDERISAWLTLARRHRRPPAELPALLAQWQDELRALDAAADLDALERASAAARAAYDAEARRVSAARRAAAPTFAAAVTKTMQQLGMSGGRFAVELAATDAPQSFGAETVEFLVAGHAGATPRPLARVASGGELSRIALAVAVVGIEPQQPGHDTPATLIFDEVDAGIGGAVAETVGRLMKQLGSGRQVLAVTHLPQVAACADHHFVVRKESRGGTVASAVEPVAGEARVAEIARMLGGEKLSSTSLAHAQEMLDAGAEDRAPAKRSSARKAAS